MTETAATLPANPKGRTRANIALAFGGVAFIAGLLLTVAPGSHVLAFSIPPQSEFVGLTFIILGLFVIQEAQNQKRYLRIKAMLREQQNSQKGHSAENHS